MKGHTINRGRKLSDEHKRKISLSNMGRIVSEETRIKIGNGNRGKTGKMNGRWNGGRFTKNGYLLVINKDHPRRKNIGYVFEHRLIVEKILGRFLKKGEEVHHIDRNRLNNKKENLMCFARKKSHRLFEEGNDVPDSEIIFDGRRL